MGTSLSKSEVFELDSDFAQKWLGDNADNLADYLDAVSIETACEHGCEVELDGKCFHGHQSPLRVLGMI